MVLSVRGGKERNEQMDRREESEREMRQCKREKKKLVNASKSTRMSFG